MIAHATDYEAAVAFFTSKRSTGAFSRSRDRLRSARRPGPLWAIAMAFYGDRLRSLRAHVYLDGDHVGWLLSRNGLACPLEEGVQVDWCGLGESAVN